MRGIIIDKEVLEKAEEVMGTIGNYNSLNDFIEQSIILQCDLWDNQKERIKTSNRVRSQHGSNRAKEPLKTDYEVLEFASFISNRLSCFDFQTWLTGGTLIGAYRDRNVLLPQWRSITVGVFSNIYDTHERMNKFKDIIIGDMDLVDEDDFDPSNCFPIKVHYGKQLLPDLPSNSNAVLMDTKNNKVTWIDNEKSKLNSSVKKKVAFLEIIFFFSKDSIFDKAEKNSQLPCYFSDGSSLIRQDKLLENGLLKKNYNFLIPFDFVFPLKKSHIYNYEFNIPNRSDKFLEMLFGSTWRLPLRNSHSFRNKMNAGQAHDLIFPIHSPNKIPYG